MDLNESEKEDSFIDDERSEEDEEDDEVCDVKSNKNQEDNEMNEVYQVAKNTHSELQLWRMVSALILVSTFVAILTVMFIIINGEHENDDDEAVSDDFTVKLLTNRFTFSSHCFTVPNVAVHSNVCESNRTVEGGAQELQASDGLHGAVHHSIQDGCI
jgi:hypothetical protein